MFAVLVEKPEITEHSVEHPHRRGVELCPVEHEVLLCIVTAGAQAVVAAGTAAASGEGVGIAKVHDQLCVAAHGILVAVALHLRTRRVTGRRVGCHSVRVPEILSSRV